MVMKKNLKKPSKKILVIYTGGTFGMRPKSAQSNHLNTYEIPDLTSIQLSQWLREQVPEMMKIADCTVDVLFNVDSCQFQAAHWFELAAHIHKNQKKYNGVVILHGTDTLAYTASALSYLLSPVTIPVVITGAQRPLATLRNDARTNFISALEYAATAPKELKNRITVVFHDEVFLGSRVRKKSATGFSAFDSPRFQKLANIGSEIEYHPIIKQLPKLNKRGMLEQFRNSANDNPLPQILRLEVTPQFSTALFNELALSKLDGILLTLYASGTAPTEQEDFMLFLERARAVSTPVFAITERESETPSLATYSAGRELLEKNVLWCGELTPEAAFVKIWLLRELHANHSREKHYSWLKKNWNHSMSDELN